jgi:exosome complex protein LRP1
VKNQKQQDLDISAPLQASTSSVPVPVKITSKMLARAQYEEELNESPSEDDEELEVFNEKDSDKVSNESDPKAKGKAADIAQQDDEVTQPTDKKRRRRPVDPFAGKLLCNDDVSSD